MQRTTIIYGILRVEVVFFLQGRTLQLIIQYQIIIPENMQINTTMQIDQVIFKNIYVSTYFHKKQLMRKESMHLKENK